MDRMAQPRDGRPIKVVLSGTIRLLAPANTSGQYRGEKKGLCPNVHAPRHYVRSDLHELWLSPDESWEHDIVSDGCS